MKSWFEWLRFRRRGPSPATSPRIHLYTMGWNEERLLPYFFRHYDPWVERYVIYDDHSTDATLEMLHAHPRVEVRTLERCVPDSFVLSAQAIHNSCWKESRGAADWVIISAIDEHLYHPDLGAYLINCKETGVTAIPALGYDMIAGEFPVGDETLWKIVPLGEPFVPMSKLSLFSPDSITETDYAVGRHSARPRGRVRYPQDDVLLNLHFKKLGLDYVLQRNRLLSTGLGPRDRANKWGFQYDLPEEQVAEWFRMRQDRALDVIAAGALAAHNHREPRWWRPGVTAGLDAGR